MVRVSSGNAGITAAAVLLAVFSLPAGFAHEIRGTVRGQDGALEKVKVDLLVDGRLVRTAYTDAAGEYALGSVPEGFVELVHSGSGLATVTVAAGKYLYPNSFRVDVVMNPALRMGGRPDTPVRLVLLFLDADSGEPLAGRKIELEGWGELKTDQLGRFAIHDPPEARVLKFKTDGYQQQVVRPGIYDHYHRMVIRLERER